MSETYRSEGEVIEPLPFPVTFVHLGASDWIDVATADPPPFPADIHARFDTGEDAWVLLSYLALKHRGHEVRLRDHFEPGELCIAHYNHIRWRQFAQRSFVVAIRADRGPVYISHHRLVQSPVLARGRRDHFVPYWPQPGLVPRDPTRGDRVERVGFMGQVRNLHPGLREDRFTEALRAEGMEFVIRTQRKDWGDYRDVDVVLAVRGDSGSTRWLQTKPPSKLVNAWLAGCPAILGSEPAFEALRESQLDYCIADDPDAALQALVRLRDDPTLYRNMVEHGRRRAGEFGFADVARRWERVLRDEIGPDYLRFQRTPKRFRDAILLARYLPRAAMQRLLPNRYLR